MMCKELRSTLKHATKKITLIYTRSCHFDASTYIGHYESFVIRDIYIECIAVYDITL